MFNSPTYGIRCGQPDYNVAEVISFADKQQQNLSNRCNFPPVGGSVTQSSTLWTHVMFVLICEIISHTLIDAGLQPHSKILLFILSLLWKSNTFSQDVSPSAIVIIIRLILMLIEFMCGSCTVLLSYSLTAHVWMQTDMRSWPLTCECLCNKPCAVVKLTCRLRNTHLSLNQMYPLSIFSSPLLLHPSPQLLSSSLPTGHSPKHSAAHSFSFHPLLFWNPPSDVAPGSGQESFTLHPNRFNQSAICCHRSFFSRELTHKVDSACALSPAPRNMLLSNHSAEHHPLRAHCSPLRLH